MVKIFRLYLDVEVIVILRKDLSWLKLRARFCKKIYVTDDNPRSEKPGKIRKEIIKNIKKRNCFNIGNRFKAIKTAILNAEPNEVLLIAGKGHETSQIYKNKTINFSDKQIIKRLNSKLKFYQVAVKILFKIKKNFVRYY